MRLFILVMLFLLVNVPIVSQIEIWQAFNSNIHNIDQNVSSPPFNFQGKVTISKKVKSVDVKFYQYENMKRTVALQWYSASNSEGAIFQGKLSIQKGETRIDVVVTLEDNATLIKSLSLENYRKMTNSKFSDYTSLISKPIHKDAVRSMVFTRDNRYLVSGGDDGYVRVSDCKTLKVVHDLRGHSGYVRAVAVTHDSKYILSGGSDGTLRIWNLKTGERVKVINAHKTQINAIALSNNGKYAVSCADNSKIALWELTDFTKVTNYVDSNDTRDYLCAVFSSDDRYLFAGDSTNRTTMYEALTGLYVTNLKNSTPVTGVGITPDMHYVYSGDTEGKIKYRKILLNPHVDDPSWRDEEDLWWDDLISLDKIVIDDYDDDEAYYKIYYNHPVKGMFASNGLTARIVHLSLTGDGKYIMLVSNSGELKITEVHTGFKRYKYKLSREATCGAFSYDGYLAATGELTGAINIYGLP